MKKCFLVVCLFLMVPLSVYAQRGCCSWHGGVSHCSEDGRYVCNDGTYSPSCTCTPTITYRYGCTNSGAINYDSSANKDDGSCILRVLGCTNSEAINYNSSANTADGSCQFSSDEVTEESIAFETKTITGKKNQVQQKGKDGTMEITTRVIRDENGNIVSSSVIERKVIEEPVEEIVMVAAVTDDTIDDEEISSDNDAMSNDDNSNDSSSAGGGILVLGIIAAVVYVIVKKKKAL